MAPPLSRSAASREIWSLGSQDLAVDRAAIKSDYLATNPFTVSVGGDHR